MKHVLLSYSTFIVVFKCYQGLPDLNVALTVAALYSVKLFGIRFLFILDLVLCIVDLLLLFQ